MSDFSMSFFSLNQIKTKQQIVIINRELMEIKIIIGILINKIHFILHVFCLTCNIDSTCASVAFARIRRRLPFLSETLDNFIIQIKNTVVLALHTYTNSGLPKSPTSLKSRLNKDHMKRSGDNSMIFY